MGRYVNVAGQVCLPTTNDYKRFVEWLNWQGWLFEDDWTDILDEEIRGKNFLNELKVIVPMMPAQNKFHNITGCFTDIQSYVDHSGLENISYDKSKTILRIYSDDGGIDVREFKNGISIDLVKSNSFEDLQQMFKEKFTDLFVEQEYLVDKKAEWERLCDDYTFDGTILEEVCELIEEWMYSWEDELIIV